MNINVMIITIVWSICATLASTQEMSMVSIAARSDQPIDGADPIQKNTIHRLIKMVRTKADDASRGLKRVYLSDRSVTCNDGSRSGFYLRKHHGSKKWIIFLEGGWYCYDQISCKKRWIQMRHMMTSTQWSESRDVGGILSPDQEENPYWWNANHVFIPYCSSDAWSGTQNRTDEKFKFMGFRILEQTIKDLLPLGLQNSTQLILSGTSAGGTGAMLNLDTMKDMLHDEMGLKHIEIRGVVDSGWFVDHPPYNAARTPAIDCIRTGMKLWNGKVPKRCEEMYKDEPWKCYFGYKLYPTLKSPLFVFQWLFDEAQMNADNVPTPKTKQQWDYIHRMGETLRNSLENVTALFAPACMSHSFLTKRDWLGIKVNDITVAQALMCWEQNLELERMQRRGVNASNDAIDTPKLRHRGNMNNERRSVEANGVKRRRKHKKERNRNGHKKKRGKKNKERRLTPGETSTHRPQRSLSKAQRRLRHHALPATCRMRAMERCSFPQCNHNCPKIHHPDTGQELDFMDLLKSFGLDMNSMAMALGMDVHQLNNMDHGELLTLLTQSGS